MAVPKISVIIPSKNGGRFLRQTLDSIVQQSFTDYEIVISDSNSTDDTLEILQEYKHNGHNVRWQSKPDRHTDEGFYNAMMMAQGEYIMLICISDWYSDLNWFKSCVEVLDSDSEVSLVYGHGKAVTVDGQIANPARNDLSKNPPPCKKDFFPFWLGTFSLCLELSWCVRADVFRKCFPEFKPTNYFMENHAIFAFNYNFNVQGYLSYFLPKYACYGREHSDSNSVTIREFNGRMKRQYRSAVIKYGNDLFSGKHKHVFRDGHSNVIGELKTGELDSCRKKVLHFRINRKFYKSTKHPGIVRYWIRKLRILTLYVLLGKRIF